jgi:hypothetical protein
VESQVWQHYQSAFPGQVQVLGGDLFDGDAANLTQFKNSTGATYPLMLKCGNTQSGNANFFIVYGDRDNYAVINKQGIVRYNAYDHWLYGNRYHYMDEIKVNIDSLVSAPVGVGDDVRSGVVSLAAAPNPFASFTAIDLVNHSGRTLDARVTVHDLAGREVAVLMNAPASTGATRLVWEGDRADGSHAPPGVYLVRARIGSTFLVRRLALVR